MEATQEKRASIWATGFAIFAMFFGAGNIVFPMALGKFTLDKNFYGILGMLLTAVIVPLIGLMGMLLYQGDYGAFFRRIGKWPGFAVTLLILGLIGPFGGIPRCITISYSTLQSCGFSGCSLLPFSLLSCAVIFCFTFRPGKVLALLGYVLTPILLLSLALIAVKGLFGMPVPPLSEHSTWETFSQGLLGGYNTMDLLAAFFFSSCVLLCLRESGEVVTKRGRAMRVAIIGSVIAAFLLAAAYISFSFLAAGYSEVLGEVPGHQLLGALAYELLGPSAGLVAGVAVSFACLTTEIALTAIFAEFLHKKIFRERYSFAVALMTTLVVVFFISILQFEGISAFLGPILEICYPALIVLSILNVLHKLYNFKPVKLLVYGTFLISLLVYLF